MRKLTANLILLPDETLASDHTLIMDGEMVVDVLPVKHPDAEYYEGVLCPGFVNAHCHLELSHLQNKITQGNKLHGFISEFVAARRASELDVEEHARQADLQMWKNGIQAVGDICNIADTFKVKSESRIRYHNFIELFNVHPAMAKEVFQSGKNLKEASEEMKLAASLVPHAPYSVPSELFKLIQKNHNSKTSVWSIHNQETASENEMFISGTGELINHFQKMGINMDWMMPSGKNSLETYSKYFPKKSNMLFVHNTYTGINDIEFLKSNGNFNRSWFCLCPNANLYIENRLPDVDLFAKMNCNVAIGTDSLASNNGLSILDEIKTIHHHFKRIPTAKLLSWATKNGAEYFGYDDLGVFRKGSRPGVLCIKGADINTIDEYALVDRVI